MKFASRYPLSSLVLISVLYYSGIIFFVEPIIFKYKLFYSVVSFFCIIIAFIFEISFTKESELIKKILFSPFVDGNFSKLAPLRKMSAWGKGSLILLLFSSIIEYIITIVLTPNSGITFGFPLPFYSFSVRRLLFLNLLTDLVFFSVIVYLVGWAIANSGIKNGNTTGT